LPNKRKLEGEIQSLIKMNTSFALMYIDFDRFKRINDTFGHFFGDKVINHIAKRLASCIEKDFKIARMGGDEFSILIPTKYNISEVAERIIKSFRKPLMIDGYEFLLTASIGISRFPQDSNNLVDLMKDADIAMYEAKKSGTDTFKIYNREMVKQKVNKLELENDLRKAIRNEELSVYYQPKYNIRMNKICGSEALVRWEHPTYGFVSPAVFIPIAEEAHLIVDLERTVIKEVFKSIESWKQNNLPTPRTSINISVLHFYQEDFLEFIEESLDEYGILGRDIEIEVTESIMVNSESGINNDIQRLRELGIEISIDDFGTGYSSLGYLQQLSIDRLKIDKSFISNSCTNREIVSTIISMAKNLNLEVIAEGVETQEHIDLLF